MNNGYQKMTEEESVDIEQELDEHLTKVQPNLQDVIKRSFTNVALQQTKNGEKTKPDTLEDTSYFAKNTQVNLSRLELVRPPTFHMQSVSLNLKSMSLSLRCSLGEVSVKGLYSAFNENLYNLIPVMAEGHVLITLSNITADVNVGLVLEDDAYSFVNLGIEFIHDEVLVKLSWPSPQRSGGYDFLTTEQLAKHIDDLPLTAAISLPLFALLQQKLEKHLSQVLRQATSVSDVVYSNPSMLEAYISMVDNLAQKRKQGSGFSIDKYEKDIISDVSRSIRTTSATCNFLHKIGYDEYRIKGMGVSCSGRVEAALADNALHLALSVGLTRWEPYAQLDDLRVQRLDGMDLHISGLGPSARSLVPCVRGRAAQRPHWPRPRSPHNYSTN